MGIITDLPLSRYHKRRKLLKFMPGNQPEMMRLTAIIISKKTPHHLQLISIGEEGTLGAVP